MEVSHPYRAPGGGLAGSPSITVVARSWPAGDGTGTYRTGFARLLDHRLRLSSPGGFQVNGFPLSGPSFEPRLRVVFKSALDGLAEALLCPDLEDSEKPRAQLRQTFSGRSDPA